MIGVLALPNALHLEIQEEAFCDVIVPAIAFSAHTANKALFIQQIPIHLAGLLAAAVGVDDQAG